MERLKTVFGRMRIPFTFAFAVILTVGLIGCQTEETEEMEAGVTVDAITDNPDQYMGQTVTLTGEVEEAYGSTAFRMGSDGLGRGIIVVAPPSATAGVSGFMGFNQSDMVQVTGTVRQSTVADIEQEYGLDLDPELDVELEAEEPVIVAESISITPGAGAPDMMDDTSGMMDDTSGMLQDTTGMGIETPVPPPGM